MYRVVCLQGQIIGWFIRHVFDVALREKKRKLKNEYIWLLVFIFLVEESRKTGGFQLVLWVETNCLSRKKNTTKGYFGYYRELCTHQSKYPDSILYP